MNENVFTSKDQEKSIKHLFTSVGRQADGITSNSLLRESVGSIT
jgi:hypothetical protein